MVWQYLGSDHGQTVTVVALNILLTLANYFRTRRNTQTLNSVNIRVNGKFDALVKRVNNLERTLHNARNPQLGDGHRGRGDAGRPGRQ